MEERKETVMNKYEAPQVEFIEVAVEKGFAMSGHGSDSDDTEFG